MAYFNANLRNGGFDFNKLKELRDNLTKDIGNFIKSIPIIGNNQGIEEYPTGLGESRPNLGKGGKSKSNENTKKRKKRPSRSNNETERNESSKFPNNKYSQNLISNTPTTSTTKSSSTAFSSSDIFDETESEKILNKKSPDESSKGSGNTGKNKDGNLIPQDKSVKQNKTGENVNTDISLDVFPKFRKAYSTLSQLTPYVNVTIFFTDKTEFQQTTISPREINLFEIPYNNVVSFEMTTGKETKATLIINDTTDLFFLSIYAYMLTLQNSGSIQILINYGWVHNNAPNLKSKEIRPVYNVRHMFLLTGITMSAESNKNIYTMSMTHTNFVGQDSFAMAAFKPKNYLGSNVFLPYVSARHLSSFLRKVYKSINTVDEVDSFGKLLADNFYNENLNGNMRLLIEKYTPMFFMKEKTKKFIKENFVSQDELKNRKLKSVFNGSLEDYIEGKTSFTLIKDDAIKNYNSIPKRLQSECINNKVSPLEAFYFLCKQAKDHAEKLNHFSETKTSVAFINLMDAKKNKNDQEKNSNMFQISKEYYEHINKSLISTIDFNFGETTRDESWEDLLNRIAQKVDLSFLKLNEKVAHLNVKSYSVSKTGDFQSEIKEIIEFLKGLQRAMTEEAKNRKIVSSIYVRKRYPIRMQKILKNFLNSEYDNLIVFLIYPEIKTNTSSLVDAAIKKSITLHKMNDINQTYTVNPFKETGSSAFAGKLKTLSEENFPDVLSFKVNNTSLTYLVDLAADLQSIKSQPIDVGDKVVFPVESSHGLKMREFSEINRMLYYNNSFYATENNYGESFANNVLARNNFITTLAGKFVALEAELEILGEPAYSINFSSFNRIFLKIFNPDGTQSFLSGVYFITSKRHNISAGRFTTSFKLRKDPTVIPYIMNDLTKEIKIPQVMVLPTNTKKSEELKPKVGEDYSHEDHLFKNLDNKIESNKSLSNVNQSGKGSMIEYTPPLDKLIVTSKQGDRHDPFSGKETRHQGVDFAGVEGRTDVFASAGGVVTFASFGQKGSGFGGYGNVVEIKHPDGSRTRYAHLDSYSVKKGDTVSQGQLIGKVGNTGKSTGAHLHFEIIRANGDRLDPEDVFKGYIKNSGSGGYPKRNQSLIDPSKLLKK